MHIYVYIHIYMRVIKSSIISAQLTSWVNILLVPAAHTTVAFAGAKVSPANEVVDRSLSDRMFSRMFDSDGIKRCLRDRG